MTGVRLTARDREVLLLVAAWQDVAELTVSDIPVAKRLSDVGLLQRGVLPGWYTLTDKGRDLADELTEHRRAA